MAVSGCGTQDLVKTVNKLKSKLREATSHGCEVGNYWR